MTLYFELVKSFCQLLTIIFELFYAVFAVIVMAILSVGISLFTGQTIPDFR
jgi:hypothetical protein